MIIDPTIDDEEVQPREAAKRIYRTILNSPYIEDEILAAFPMITPEEKKEVKECLREVKEKLFQSLR